MRRLTCRSCGASLRAGDFDRRKAILTCRHCETLVDLGKAPALPEGAAREPLQKAVITKPRAVAALPEGWTMARTGGHLEIGFRTSKSEDKLGAAILALRMCATLFSVFALFHLLVDQDGNRAMHLGIAALACFALMLPLHWHRRSMYLATDRRHLWLGKWKANKPLIRVPVADVVQFYVAERVQYPDQDKFGPYSSRTLVDYHLCAILGSETGPKTRVIATFDSPRPALFLEQTFEEYLGIADRHVAGEIEAPSFAM